MIDEISFFFDRSFKNIMMTFDNIEKSLARQTYFTQSIIFSTIHTSKKTIIALDLNIQKVLDTDPIAA